MIIKIAHLDPKSDSILGVYIDDKLIKGGDEAHQNMTQWLCAFLHGIRVTGNIYNLDHHYTKTIQNAPDYFKDIDFKAEVL